MPRLSSKTRVCVVPRSNKEIWANLKSHQFYLISDLAQVFVHLAAIRNSQVTHIRSDKSDKFFTTTIVIPSPDGVVLLVLVVLEVMSLTLTSENQ